MTVKIRPPLTPLDLVVIALICLFCIVAGAVAIDLNPDFADPDALPGDTP